MDFDPVILARLQFAFTIIFHIIFPSFTIGLSAYIATLGVMWLRTGREHFHVLMRFWTKIFAVSFAMGVVSGIVLSYQFGTNWSRFSVVAGNVVGPLIGYEVLTAFFLEATFLGVLLFGCNRCRRGCTCCRRLWSRPAPRCRRSGFWRPTAGCRRRPATRCATASPIRPTGSPIIFNPSFPYRFAHMLNAAYLTTAFVVLAVGARYLLAGKYQRGSAHHAAHGDRAHRHPCAVAAFHRRPARPQHAQAPADQDRGDGGALGRFGPRRLRDFRLAGREGGDQPFFDFHSARLVAHPDAFLERAVSGLEERAARRPAAGYPGVLRLPHHGRASACS